VGAQLQVNTGKRGAKRSPVQPSMNVTPLVDVVLVLLIIFMVITPMLVKQLSVNVPTKPEDDKVAEPASPDDEPQIVLRVDRAGLAYINKLQVPDEHLNVRLKRVFAARADQTLFFDADDDVPFERALAVLDIARGTGLATIAVLTEPVTVQ
jgi:biopolymer transport protein ExbD